MRRSIIITLLLFGMGGTAWILSSNQGIKDKIIACFKTGSVEKISASLSEDIFLTLFDEEEFESKQAVEKKLTDFFEQFPPKDFKIKHQGTSVKGNSFYLIGLLHTTENVFRVRLTIDNKMIEDINIIFEKPISDMLQ